MLAPLRLCWQLLIAPETTWVKLVEKPNHHKQFVSEYLLPCMGICAGLLFLTGGFPLETNLKMLILFLSPFYFAFLLQNWAFKSFYARKLNTDAEAYSKLLVVAVLPYLLCSTIAAVLENWAWLCLACEAAGILFAAGVCYKGCRVLLKHQPLPALVWVGVHVTSFIVLFKLIFSLLRFIAAYSGIDLLESLGD